MGQEKLGENFATYRIDYIIFCAILRVTVVTCDY